MNQYLENNGLSKIASTLLFAILLIFILVGCDNSKNGNDSKEAISPVPNPMTWKTEPFSTGRTSLKMEATGVSGYEYLFKEIYGNGHDSGWQDASRYEDTGLDEGRCYIYAVKARNKSNHNETQFSSAKPVTTQYTTQEGFLISELDDVDPDYYVRHSSTHLAMGKDNSVHICYRGSNYDLRYATNANASGFTTEVYKQTIF
jgi:hypothetical protein